MLRPKVKSASEDALNRFNMRAISQCGATASHLLSMKDV